MNQPKKKPTRALLAQFTVELSQDGKVYLENKSVNPEVFRKAMDEWNQDYKLKKNGRCYASWERMYNVVCRVL